MTICLNGSTARSASSANEKAPAAGTTGTEDRTMFREKERQNKELTCILAQDTAIVK